MFLQIYRVIQFSESEAFFFIDFYNCKIATPLRCSYNNISIENKEFINDKKVVELQHYNQKDTNLTNESGMITEFRKPPKRQNIQPRTCPPRLQLLFNFWNILVALNKLWTGELLNSAWPFGGLVADVFRKGVGKRGDWGVSPLLPLPENAGCWLGKQQVDLRVVVLNRTS